VAGLRVTEVEHEADGQVTVWAVTAGTPPCPGCRTVPEHVHEYVMTRPRDVRHGAGEVALCLVKRRWECESGNCPQNTFTESLPQVPPRCRITRRLREQAGTEVRDRGVTPAEAARHAGVSWPVAHDAFAAAADPLLDHPPAPVAHLGIDEHRRGKPRWTTDQQTGEYQLLADRWHTCFFDLSAGQGLLGQVEGRTADDAAYWLAQATPAWRDRVRVVAIDMCAIYLSAVRRMLPHAQVAVDLFHVVHLAVNTVGDVRRRAARGKYGRRGKSGDPEYGIKNLLTRNLEHQTAAQFATIIETLDADAAGQQTAAAWIAKEKLRDVLNLRARVTGSTPCERNVRDRLFAFYDWCAQHEDIPELISLAKTIARWEDHIVCAVLTGVTNATSESLNRLAKLEARQAYGFRNPANQRRRVRIACTRRQRRPARTASPETEARTVTGRQPDPGYLRRPSKPPSALGISGWVWGREQVIKELVQDFGGPGAVGDLVPAEPVDLVFGEAEFAVSGDHLGVAFRVGAALAVGVVLDAVDLQDDAAVSVEQEQEVHPLPGQGSSGPATVRVVVQVDLRDERRNVEPVSTVPSAVPLENKTLGSVAVHGLQQPGVEFVPGCAFFLAYQALAARPPCGELPPGQSCLGQRPVVDQAVLGVLDDVQVVVYRVADHDPRLRAVGGEDQVLHLAAHAVRPVHAEQMVEDAVVVVHGGDVTAKREQLGQPPVPDSPLDVAPLTPPRAVFVLCSGPSGQP
jgi:transposase